MNRREDLFVSTPTLEAKQILFSMVDVRDRTRRGDTSKLDFIDVRRAYFQANARRAVYIELPAEDWEEGMCGKLVKPMYGTRDAAQNWEEEYSGFMELLGFIRGIASPCIFFHPGRKSELLYTGTISRCWGMITS